MTSNPGKKRRVRLVNDDFEPCDSPQLQHLSNCFSSLPTDLLRIICEFLPPVPDRMHADRVNRALHSAIHHPLSPTCTEISFMSCPSRLSADRIMSAICRWTSSSEASPFLPGISIGLQSLNLNTCLQMTNKVMPRLAPFLFGLRHLTLTGCTQLGDAGLRALLDVCGPSLQELNLSHCVSVMSALNHLRHGVDFRQLRRGDFSFCTNLATQRLFEVLSGSAVLESIDVSGVNAPIPSQIFLHLSTCSRLQSLMLRGCHITASPDRRLGGDGGVLSVNLLLDHCHQLRVLDLAGVQPRSPAITPITSSSGSLHVLNLNRSHVSELAPTARFQALLELHVAWVTQLSDDCIRRTALAVVGPPGLRVLDASGTCISESTRSALLQRWPHLHLYLASCRSIARAHRTTAPGELADTE